MAMCNEKGIMKEYNNFLAAYHELKFSKIIEDEEVNAENLANREEILNIKRRCVAAKYLAAKKLGYEDIATCVLESSLEDYAKWMDSKANNNWNCIDMFLRNTRNNISEWNSGLNNVQSALNFIKCLPCQKDNTLSCKGKTINDHHIKDIIDTWEIQDVRRRKNTSQEKPVLRMEATNNDKSLFENRSTLKREIQSVSFSGSSFKNKKEYIESDKEESQNSVNRYSAFKTARDELSAQQIARNKSVQKKTLGGKPAINSQFICPLKREKEKAMQTQSSTMETYSAETEDSRLKNIDPKMIELVKNEIMDLRTSISWDDIAGLEYAKKIIKEVIVFPMLRPDIFTGLRRPPKGILLFGPPGTGKTLIGRCIAAQSKSTFFSISASSLTSKWIGEGEKMVRALFAVARVHQPSVVFIDEVDSLLSQRSETEHESSRRLKTEFLVQLDGAATSEEDRILIIGATNRPQELDEAARRRLVKRLYIPLPELEARKQIINNLLTSVPNNITLNDVTDIAERSEGYSGADMANLCKEASMGPIRCIPFSQLENIQTEQIRPVTINDFKEALQNVRPSVSQADLSVYIEWDRTYGTGYLQNANA